MNGALRDPGVHRLNDPNGIVEHILTLMSECALDPGPANYEFLYRYVTGADPQIVRAVDAVRDRGGRLSQGAINAIRRELHGVTDLGICRLIEDTERQLARVSDYVERTDAGTRTYRDALQRHPIEHGATLERQRAMLRAIIDATAGMIAQQEALLDELAQSGHEIDLLKVELETARTDARIDMLTGLANRKACAAYLDAQIALAGADGLPLSLIFIDIDHFKAFNDSHGHRVGDEVLRLVGQSLERAFHGRGFVARWGGEEFVAVMPRHGAAAAAGVAETFRESISARTVRTRQAGAPVGRITLSLGVAELQAGDAAQALVDRADRALYDAKADGRNRVVTWQDAA